MGRRFPQTVRPRSGFVRPSTLVALRNISAQHQVFTLDEHPIQESAMVTSISIDDTRTRHPHFAGMPWNLLPSTKASGRSTPAATPRPNGWAAFWGGLVWQSGRPWFDKNLSVPGN